MDKSVSRSDRLELVRQYSVKANTPVLAVKTSDPLDRAHTVEIKRRERLRLPGASRLGREPTLAMLRLVPYFSDYNEGPFLAFLLDGWAFLVPEANVERAG